MVSIFPVILAGGVGMRLWPVSRESMPKQFVSLVGKRSLFQESVLRLKGQDLQPSKVITSSNYRFLVSKQLKEICSDADVYLEPVGKNTAPAIIAAAQLSEERDPGSLMLVAPSDHYIPDVKAFHESILEAKNAAKLGDIITFGVRPTRPETGYGYIERGDDRIGLCRKVINFIEKPNAQTAQKMLDSGDFLWNAGIFLFRADVMLSLAEKYQPDMTSAVKLSVQNGESDLDFFRFESKSWGGIGEVSIDYGIMEKAENLSCIELKSEWHDLGDWQSVSEVVGHDKHNNFITKNSTSKDCKNTTLWSTSERMHIAGLGLENIIAVATEDAVLVANADHTQEVKEIVEELEKKDVNQAKQHVRDERPWGWFESLIDLPTYQVKILHVYPGARLSLQSHKFRSEHWVVVGGTATIWRDKEMFTLESNASVFINAGQKHRLANETEEELTVIEVQTGSYLGEDDIIRYEDVYQRKE
tara:strand:+ start:1806 stop:3224 length:1419 start_codon:yes stop_codon:yes gene_type:complete